MVGSNPGGRFPLGIGSICKMKRRKEKRNKNKEKKILVYPPIWTPSTPKVIQFPEYGNKTMWTWFLKCHYCQISGTTELNLTCHIKLKNDLQNTERAKIKEMQVNNQENGIYVEI